MMCYPTMLCKTDVSKGIEQGKRFLGKGRGLDVYKAICNTFVFENNPEGEY